MKENKLKTQFISICFFVLIFSYAKSSDDNRLINDSAAQPALQHHNLRIQNFQTELPPFCEIQKLYQSEHPKYKKIGRSIIRTIAEDNGNENQIESIEILFNSDVIKDSLFAKNCIFNIILHPDTFSEKTIIDVAKIIFPKNRLYNSDELVGARILIRYPGYEYSSSLALYESDFARDQKKGLKMFRLMAKNKEWDLKERLSVSNQLYPMKEFLRKKQVLDSDKAIALEVYCDAVRKFTSLPDIEERNINKLYDISLFLLEEENKGIKDVGETGLKKIASMYETFLEKSCNACKELCKNHYNENKEIILKAYDYKFYGWNNTKYGMMEYEKEQLYVLINSKDKYYRKRVFDTCFNALRTMMRAMNEKGGGIDPNMLYFQSVLVKMGHGYFVKIEYNPCLMDKLPEKEQLRKNKLYLEKKGKQLKYKAISPDNEIVEGIYDTQVEGNIISTILDSLKRKILEKMVKDGHSMEEQRADLYVLNNIRSTINYINSRNPAKYKRPERKSFGSKYDALLFDEENQYMLSIALTMRQMITYLLIEEWCRQQGNADIAKICMLLYWLDSEKTIKEKFTALYKETDELADTLGKSFN